jgi:hypothetical protein
LETELLKMVCHSHVLIIIGHRLTSSAKLSGERPATCSPESDRRGLHALRWLRRNLDPVAVDLHHSSRSIAALLIIVSRPNQSLVLAELGWSARHSRTDTAALEALDFVLELLDFVVEGGHVGTECAIDDSGAVELVLELLDVFLCLRGNVRVAERLVDCFHRVELVLQCLDLGLELSDLLLLLGGLLGEVLLEKVVEGRDKDIKLTAC